MHDAAGAMICKTMCLIFSAILLVQAAAQDYASCWQQAKIMGQDTRPGDYFGGSLSISGDTLVVVAPNQDYLAEDAGAGYVFARTADKWSQEAKLIGNDTARKHHFGRSVSISGDSVVIGARTYEGTAYVFVRSQTTWGAQWTEQAKLQAQDKRGGDEFGRAVAISGDLIVVGAVNGDEQGGNYAGAAYVFIRSGLSWRQDQKIFAADTKPGHYFGDSVAVSGSTVVVGTSPASFGAVYVFTRSDTTGAWTQQAKIYRSGAMGGDDFGASIAMYHHTLVIGAPGDDVGLNDAGAVYIYSRDGATWSQQAKIGAEEKAEGHRFGSSVSISDNRLAVAAQGVRDQAGNYGGSAYVFALHGSNWTQQMRVQGVDTAFGDRFGQSVGVAGNYVAAGAPRQSQGGTSAGAAYMLKCVTTTTSTTTPWIGGGQYIFGGFSDGTNAPQAMAVTSSAPDRPWTSMFLVALCTLLAACH